MSISRNRCAPNCSSRPASCSRNEVGPEPATQIVVFRASGTGREQLPGFVAIPNQVVARSPDLATSPTEGLQPRPRRETCGPAGPPERGGRGLETRAEQRLRIWISRDPQGGGGLDRSAPGARGRGPIRGRSGRAARSRIWEGVALPPEPIEAREPPSGEGGRPSEESAPDRADRARERGVSAVAGGGVASRS